MILPKPLHPVFFAALLSGLVSCGGKGGRDGGTEPSERVPGPRYAVSAREIVAAMTLEEKCAQLLMISLGGAKGPPPGFAAAYEAVPAGGVLLLGYNLPESAEGIIGMTSGLQAAALRSRTGIPLFLAVDHEGGEVYRFGKIMTPLPSAAAMALRDRSEAYGIYLNSASQLAALGFSMNFAPLLETLTAENKAFLRTRAYSADPAEAAAFGGLFADALRAAGVAAVGKHFPGSGGGDPHRELPKIEGFSDPGERERALRPFRSAIEKNRLPGLMVSHVLVPGLDPAGPATLSSRLQEDLARGELGFKGLLVSDDLNMRALASVLPPEKAAAAAVRAGTDLLMYLPNDYPKIRTALVRAVREGELKTDRVDEAARRIVEAKLEAGLWLSVREDSGRRRASFYLLKEQGDEMLGSLR